MKNIIPHEVIVTLRVVRRFVVDARTPEEAEAIVEAQNYDADAAYLEEEVEVEEVEAFPQEESDADNEDA